MSEHNEKIGLISKICLRFNKILTKAISKYWLNEFFPLEDERIGKIEEYIRDYATGKGQGP